MRAYEVEMEYQRFPGEALRSVTANVAAATIEGAIRKARSVARRVYNRPAVVVSVVGSPRFDA